LNEEEEEMFEGERGAFLFFTSMFDVWRSMLDVRGDAARSKSLNVLKSERGASFSEL
jgi:hypothetical protein